MEKRTKSRFFSRSSQPVFDDEMSPDYHDHLAVQNTLALYCVCLDTKDFNLLGEVFTVDVEADFPFGTARGLQETSLMLSRQLAPTTTHHALTTQHINWPLNQPTHKRRSSSTRGPTMASVMTYFTATHFGKGPWAGHTCTTYGKYINELVRIADDTGSDNDTGYGSDQWRICRHEVKFMAKVGDERVLGSNGPSIFSSVGNSLNGSLTDGRQY